MNNLPIIPGLYGFGTDTRAAYGAKNPPEICIVDSLLTTVGKPTWDDYTYPVGVYRGTLIQCLEGVDTIKGGSVSGHYITPNSGKIILFEVSGTIRQQAPADADNTFRYKIGSYTTIAGQTSPDPGILLRNICMFGGSRHDILIQHLRGRMDGPPTTNYGLHKSFTFSSGSSNTYNIVVDHISAAWGEDGQITFFKSTGELHNITLSHCIMAEARENMGLTDEEDNNGKNCLFGGQQGQGNNILVYGNLFSNSKKRNPAIFNSRAAIVNNYMYNNGALCVQLVGLNGPIEVSMVGNVIKGGPMSGSYASDKNPNFMFYNWVEPLTQHSIYLYDNKADLGTQSDSTDWLSPGFAVDIRPSAANIYADIITDKTNYIKVTGENPPTDAPLWPTGLSYMSSSAVKDYIIDNAGAYPVFRDSLDTRFINEMITGTGPSSTVKGKPALEDWPVLAENRITLNIPLNPHADSGNGYTNLEIWLHALAAEVEGKPHDPCMGVVCDNICIGDDLWSQECEAGICVADQLLESNSPTCVTDPCEGVVCDDICIGTDLYSQKCEGGICVIDQLIESNSVTCGIDLCEGIVCSNICVGNDLWSQKCDPVTGLCITDQLLESNSSLCDIELCEGIVCSNTCIGSNLWSRRCIAGMCVPDQLIERNSDLCDIGLCEGVVCPNICVDNDLWSQNCDINTGDCVLDQLLQPDSATCIVTDYVPSDESTIQTYLVLGGIGLAGLAILMLGKNR